VLDCALDALIEAKMKRKFAKASGSKTAERRPAEAATSEASTAKRPSKTTSSGRRSRHIPNAIKRAVLERDGQRCTFVDERGQRCSATHRLEFHHRDPYALGGEHSVDNITLLCAAHNAWAARQDFGARVERFRGEPRTLREPRAVYRLSG
jgi:5-methylcytosine-specific restriction endonuclease McrA